MHPPVGTKVWLINTTHGYIDHCRYKTVTALDKSRRCYWRTENGAAQAFANIERRFPKLGPTYELWEGVMAVYCSDWLHAVPVTRIDTKTV